MWILINIYEKYNRRSNKNMTNFKWHREFVTQEIYKNSMEIPEDNKQKSFEITVKDSDKDNDHKTITIPVELLDGLQGSKHLTAYNVASDIRKFEIGLFWHRAAYFWAFITVIYIAYFNVLKDLYEKQHGKLPLVILCLLGLFFSFSWYLTSKASKHWQENWELHLDLLEDGITGPLYKTYLSEKSYSVSKINIFAGIVISICSYGLLLYEFVIFTKECLHLYGCIAILACFSFAILILFGLFVYSKISIGNEKSSGDSNLQEKVYER